MSNVLGKAALSYYTSTHIQNAFKQRSTLSLFKEKATLTLLGNKKISQPLGRIVNTLPDLIIDTPPISWMFKPIASQFGTVNSNLDKVLDGFKPDDIADLAKEGLGIHEDPRMILDRHLLTIRHPNVKQMALKLSSFVPLELLSTGIETPAFENGLILMDRICKEASQLGKKVYIDAEGVAEQRLIDRAQSLLSERYGDTVYLTFQAVRSDSLSKLEKHLEFCLKTGTPPLIKAVKGAYLQKEKAQFPTFYNPTFEATDITFRSMLGLVSHYPGEKHQFIGTMNPELILFSQKFLNSTECTIGNLKGMEVAPSLGIPTLIYHPIALRPSELAKYGVRRLIELGDSSNLTYRRAYLINRALEERLTKAHNDNALTYTLSQSDHNILSQETFKISTLLIRTFSQAHVTHLNTEKAIDLLINRPNLSTTDSEKTQTLESLKTLLGLQPQHPVFTSPKLIDTIVSLGKENHSLSFGVALTEFISDHIRLNPNYSSLWVTPKIRDLLVAHSKSMTKIVTLGSRAEAIIHTLASLSPEGAELFNTRDIQDLLSAIQTHRHQVLNFPGF